MKDKEDLAISSFRKAYIPYTQAIMTTQIMPQNNKYKTFRDVIQAGVLPKQLFVFFVDHQAFSGKEVYISSRNVREMLIF